MVAEGGEGSAREGSCVTLVSKLVTLADTAPAGQPDAWVTDAQLLLDGGMLPLEQSRYLYSRQAPGPEWEPNAWRDWALGDKGPEPRNRP